MPLHLFEAFGLELEYMLVDRTTLAVVPATDRLLSAVAPDPAEPYPTEVERSDGLSWSNELALHVVELKTTEPAPAFRELPSRFDRHVAQVNELLAPHNAMLMPAAMHPWMDPGAEMRLWPHEYSPVYEAFNRIFDCRGHGWANLQSVHLNLPFQGDEEFGRLHAAIRLILPILPALCASSPMMDGRLTGMLDNRLHVYQSNARRVPSISGDVIPEPAYSREQYQRLILDRIYGDLAPHDPEGTLRFEWANARGAIARFDRSAIEIRVMDVQECPAADVAICATVAGVLQALVGQRWSETYTQQAWAVQPLKAILLDCIRDGDAAIITNQAYLRTLGIGDESCTAADVWRHLIANTRPTADEDADARRPIEYILEHGPLARRLMRAIVGHDLPKGDPGRTPPRERVTEVYRELCNCLADGRFFLGA